MLALYLYFMGTVCRDVQHFVEGKILKVSICVSNAHLNVFPLIFPSGVFNLGLCFLQIRALTELCLFTEAVNEAVQVIHGTGVCLPNGHYINQDNLQVCTHTLLLL